MTRVAARRIVAVMQNKDARWHLPICERPCETMGHDHLAPPICVTVSDPYRGRSPRPALAVRANPDGFPECFDGLIVGTGAPSAWLGLKHSHGLHQH